MNPELYNLIRPHYRDLEGYVSAGMEIPKDDNLIFMNANENPYELPDLEGFNRYPEPQPAALLEAYAQAYNTHPDHIAMTRGADEAISVLIDLFCTPEQDSILINPPTFGIYDVSARAMPAHVIEVPLLKSENGSFKLDDLKIIEQATNEENNVKIVFLCSPNNPTGTSFELERMIRICKDLEGRAIVIVDEAYIEFATQSSMSAYLKELPNLIILRTLSKSYALAGMRMGTLLCADRDFIQLVRTKGLETYPLPLASIDAAKKALQSGMRKIVFENIEKIRAERQRIIPFFQDSFIVRHIYPSDANFLLVEMEGAQGFIEYCALNKIILRDFSRGALTKDCIRISIGTPEQNDRLLTLLMRYEAQIVVGVPTLAGLESGV